MDMEIILRVRDYSDGVNGATKYEEDKDDRKLRKRLAVDFQREHHVDNAGGATFLLFPFAPTYFCFLNPR
jgi:hypothetical protein